MPPENKTRALVQECYAHLSELERLVSTNPNIDQRQAYIEMEYSLLGDLERSLSYDNDSKDSGSDVEEDEDDEAIEILTSKIGKINEMIVKVRKELANYEKNSRETKIVLARLVPECTMALKELDFIATFYSENSDPSATFREELRHDLEEYEQWDLEEQIPAFRSISAGCKSALDVARKHFLNDEDKLNDPAIQKHILTQFNVLWEQIKHFNSREAKHQLYKLSKAYKCSRQLESLFAKRATSDIHIAGFRKSIVELQDKRGCMPFNFGFKAYLQARAAHTEGLQESNDAQIKKACQSLLAACLKMKQYVLTHTPLETVAIVPVLQFNL